MWYLVASIFQFFVYFHEEKNPVLLYPALFLLINKLHIFKSHLLPSVCQFYKLEKIAGRRWVVAAGAVCRAGQPWGGFRLSHRVGGHPTGVQYIPAAASTAAAPAPSPCVAPGMRGHLPSAVMFFESGQLLEMVI